jgi:hypothetical protein
MPWAMGHLAAPELSRTRELALLSPEKMSPRQTTFWPGRPVLDLGIRHGPASRIATTRSISTRRWARMLATEATCGGNPAENR